MELKLKKVTTSQEDGKPDKITLRWTGASPEGVDVTLTVTGSDLSEISKVCPTRTGTVAGFSLSRVYADITEYAQEDKTTVQEEDQDAREEALEVEIQEAERIIKATGLLTEDSLAAEYQDLVQFYRSGDPREVTDPDALQRRRAAYEASQDAQEAQF